MRRIVLALIALFVFARPALADPVLMISIDGLRPGDVIKAEEKGLKLPNLHRFVVEGSYASGVVGVLPTVTYPSHTTLLTGVSPAKHGIAHNLAFDPLQMNHHGWTWYASDIKLPTLWEGAAQAGIAVGNVHWPVSVGPRGVKWNLPQIWRTGHSDDAKLLGMLATPRLIAMLERETGESYPLGIDEGIEADEARGRFAQAMIRTLHPGFVTVYLASLDHFQHEDGPDSPQSRAALERIDAIVGKLVEVQMATHKNGIVAVVSDHGFAAVSRETNLFHAFIDEGLITLDAQQKVASWQAMPVSEDGVVMITLAQPEDQALLARVRGVLERIKADPRSGIDQIFDKAAIAGMGGDPAASLMVSFRIGTIGGDFDGIKPPLFGPAGIKGTHGYLSSEPAMQSTFMVMGHQVPRGRNLGQIDMRAIAPTLARLMGFALPTAEKPALQF